MPAQAFRWTNSPENFNFSGPEALRAFFFPRQTLQMKEAARVLGIGREALYKRQWRGGGFALRISQRAGGRQYVLLEDLIAYLFPQENPLPTAPANAQSDYTNGVITEKRKPGRPRGAKNKAKAPGEGGAK